MNIFYPNDTLDSSLARGVALGFFDGVHRGHQDLIRTMVYQCQVKGLRPTVYTFPEHPLVTLSPEGQFAGYLSTLDQRLQRIADTGVAEVCLQPFSPEFAAMPAVEFLDDILGARLNAHLVVVGKDYRFGQGGEGDIHLLRSWGEQHQCEIIVVPEVRLHGDKVSSSRIRRLIAEGDTRLAESCLGFPFAMTGTVIEGKKLGRKLGFPTVNIAIDSDLAIPAYGVYATRTRVGNRTYESITNIGIRPTIQDESPKPNIESFLFDTSLDLYGQAITVEFLYRLRPEAVFESLLDLVAQVKEDLAQARAYHRSCEQGYEFANVRGIPVRIIRTTRFAQATAIITYRTRIDRRTASLLSLLSRILSASCQDYPSRSSLTAALDSLYGASIETEVSKDGDLFSLHIAVNGLMNWTDRSSPFAAALGVFFSLLIRPDLDADGLFQAVSFEAERSGLVMELLARENDKAKYAHDQCMKLLCGDQPFGLLAAGDLETLQGLTREDLTAAFHQLKQLDCQVAIAGDLPDSLLESLLEHVAQLRPASPDGPGATSRPARTVSSQAASFYTPTQSLLPAAFRPMLPAEKVESKKVEQARICLAFSGLQPYFSHHSIVDTLMNSMLGGDVHSLLFEVVREQLGLAYSVYSVNSRYLSTLLVIAGVAPDRVHEARQAMFAQIENLASGRFSDQLLERSKTLVESHIRSIPDDLDNLLSHLMNGVNLGRTISVQDSLSLLDRVDRQAVIERASQLKLSASFTLTAKESSDE